uniref:Uncharacterized protein n=2 Tax=Arundo donax TaxID=35708 RepID=A0A0A9GAA1_ARUDO
MRKQDHLASCKFFFQFGFSGQMFSRLPELKKHDLNSYLVVPCHDLCCYIETCLV